MSLPLYQVVEWDTHFEHAKSRTIEKCQYLTIPNKQGGSGWSNIMSEPDGAAIYGIWVSILQVCSRQLGGRNSAREGWLTADGKKTGRRLTARELANQFRRPVEEIHRTLQVVTSPEVAFMRLVDGTPEILAGYRADTSRAPEGYLEDTQVPAPVIAEGKKQPMAPEGYLEDTSRIPEGYLEDTSSPLSVSCSDNDRKIDRKKERDRAHEKIEAREAKPLLRQLCIDVFPSEARQVEQGVMWPRHWEQWLDEGTPLSKDDWQLLDWAYRTSRDHKLHSVTRLKQSFAKLLENLPSEAQKIRSARRQLGLNGLHDSAKLEQDDWPPGGRVAAGFLWPGRTLPPRFKDLPLDAQRDVRKQLEVVTS